MKSSSLSQTIVEPYAEALMSLAKEQGLVGDIGNDVELILAALSSSDDLKRFLSVPLIKDEAKKATINSVFGSQVNPLTLNFLLLLVDRSRILFLEPVCLKFQALLRQMNQIAFAEVTSAVPLSDDQQNTLRHRVREMTNAQGVELQIKVDPELIGGLIVKVGSQIVDASIRGQLRRFTSNLVVSSY
ncbi:ATP synthase F1 subunit delta [Pseudanabaena sp. PCC 6802]|uniref:ATP synthase F1 subunit delta n=1 Tax=Pseudanabaena sp. PCC 6802 TaxID=118173 RepID=UPI000349B284|nr:ATP synthase F1 subunit delta [Pseudanabaena sp. PCC 6802]